MTREVVIITRNIFKVSHEENKKHQTDTAYTGGIAAVVKE